MNFLLKLCVFFIAVGFSKNLKAQENPNNYNPFAPLGKKGKIVTANGDRFVEVFDTDSLQRIGSVIFHIYTKKIVVLLDADSTFQIVSDNSSSSRWYSPDPLAFMYFSYSPYNFTLNNPIRYIDPDGRLVIGATRDDAKKFQEDLNAMLKDGAYDQFRGLIGHKGKTFKKIDQAAFDKATAGLNEDQMAFAQTVFNTINSSDQHVVEYVAKDALVSAEASQLMNEKSGGILKPTMDQNDGQLKGATIAGLWGATTVKSSTGSHSVIIEGLTAAEAGVDYLDAATNTKGGNPAGRPSTAGHEVFGHGRFIATSGEDASGHHINAVRMENLILRVMGNGGVQRTGEGHGLRTVVPEQSKLPKL